MIQKAMTGKQVVRLMRRYRVTMRCLKSKTGITLKRIRHVRKHGLERCTVARDWIEAITGADPGAELTALKIGEIVEKKKTN